MRPIGAKEWSRETDKDIAVTNRAAYKFAGDDQKSSSLRQRNPRSLVIMIAVG